MTQPVEFRFFVSMISIYALLVLGLILTAFHTERVLRFITSPHRAFTQRELSWTRWTAILGILCFSELIIWLLFRFLQNGGFR